MGSKFNLYLNFLFLLLFQVMINQDCIIKWLKNG